jgi:electron transport complex protein RnfC
LPLRPFKALSTTAGIERPPSPSSLTIAMQQHAGPPAEPTVSVGERVAVGQMIGVPREPRAVAVHAAAAGVVTAIGQRQIPTGAALITSQCVVVEVDPHVRTSDTRSRSTWPTDRAARLEAIRHGGIVGLGGATFPTDIKLGLDRACDTLIINGAECEPYISCDDMLMRQHASEIIDGAGLMLDLLGASRCIVAVEGDKVVALEALRTALQAAADPRFELVGLPIVYPAGGEKQLVESLLDVEVPSGALPGDLRIGCQNVGTAYALADLARRGRPLTSRIVTVTGHGLAAPRNVEAPIGMPIRELLSFCGGLRSDAFQLILGGNMMGYALPSDDIPVTKATNCVIALTKAEAWIPEQEWPCIRCGDCATVCPARLQPQELLRSARSDRHSDLNELGLDDCIECGCCDVVCPSHIPLTSTFRKGKRSLTQYRRQHERAAAAEIHHAAHTERIAREADAREREQSQLTSTVTADDAARRAAIAAAVDRARAKRNVRLDD